MLAALDGVDAGGRIEAFFKDRIEMAIWFHDVVYDPKSATNEADSAALFVELLGAELENVNVTAIERLILATDPRCDRGEAVDECILVDIDLLVLASDEAGYEQYAEAIRKEYAHVPAEAFSQGRAKVLGRILQQSIYVTEHFRGFEEQARSNLEAEIAALMP
ncbi:MAG: putative metal-dependent HD superfamily phosphohydrolase [Verrucomicrobiales bacterium]|jgi:predicted metal-dependent HD superfamily phosphohydrolase